jgi:uncharacterized phiE125 gp8 family phage protein
MRIVVVTPPADPGGILPLEEVKDHLRADSGDDDALIGIYTGAAIAHLDGPMGWLGRALAPQTLELRLDGFPCVEMALRCGPVTGVTSIAFIDQAGVEQTLDPSGYQLRGDYIGLGYAARWPAHRAEAEAVRIRYQAGWPTLPLPIKAALLLMIEDLYVNRGTSSEKERFEIPMPAGVTALLAPYRVY